MREINPAETSRAWAFEHWLKAPMPMVTFFKTLNIARAIKTAKKRRLKLNMLLCWCVGMAARNIAEFYMLPVGGKMMAYDTLAVNTIVLNKTGEVSSCDIPFTEDLAQFNTCYLALTAQVAQTCANHDLPESMVIGTSNVATYNIDGAIGMYSGIYNNPFLIWGKYKKKLFRAELKISFQFHHTQMDGAHAARFLECFQEAVFDLKNI